MDKDKGSIKELFKNINLLTEIVDYIDERKRLEIAMVNKKMSNAVRNSYSSIKFKPESQVTPELLKEKLQRFPGIVNLILERNSLTKLDFFKGVFLDKISSFNISHNTINDLSELGKYKFNNIKLLDIEFCKCKNLEFLGGGRFKNLEYLDISGNDLEDKDVTILKNADLVNLRTLYMKVNNIKNLSFLKDIKFKNLIDLDFRVNQVDNIDFLREKQFGTLQIFYGYNNKIKDISAFESPHLINLKRVYMGDNEVTTLDPFSLKQYKELEQLKFGTNKISNIDKIFYNGVYTNLQIWLIKNPLNNKGTTEDYKKRNITLYT